MQQPNPIQAYAERESLFMSSTDPIKDLHNVTITSQSPTTKYIKTAKATFTISTFTGGSKKAHVTLFSSTSQGFEQTTSSQPESWSQVDSRNVVTQYPYSGIYCHLNSCHLQIHRLAHPYLTTLQDPKRTLVHPHFAHLDTVDQIPVPREQEGPCCSFEAWVSGSSCSKWAECEWYWRVKNCVCRWLWERPVVLYLWQLWVSCDAYPRYTS